MSETQGDNGGQDMSNEVYPPPPWRAVEHPNEKGIFKVVSDRGNIKPPLNAVAGWLDSPTAHLIAAAPDMAEKIEKQDALTKRMLVMLKETQFSLKETLDNPSRAGKYDQWLHDEISQVIAEAGGENEK